MLIDLTKSLLWLWLPVKIDENFYQKNLYLAFKMAATAILVTKVKSELSLNFTDSFWLII